MSIKTIWLWWNIAKVAALWALSMLALIVVLLLFKETNTVALLAGVVVGFITGQVGLAIWPCWKFTY